MKDVKTKPKNGPWGRLQSKGQKRAFTEEQVQLIRANLEMQKTYPGHRGAIREVALLETALSTCLRSSDLLALRVSEVLAGGRIVDKIPVKQKKTGKVILVPLRERARLALMAWIQQDGLVNNVRLFDFSRQYYGDIVKTWARMVHADPRTYSTHSMRRTHPTHVYLKTHNAAAASRMLGHDDLAQTIHYLSVGVTEAHKLAEEHEI